MPPRGTPVPMLELESILAKLGIAASEASAKAAYTVLSGRNGPRWVLPENSALALTVLREWHPYDLRARLLWSVVPMAARAGALRLLPGAKRVELPADASEQFISRFGLSFDASQPVVLVGNTVATRKLLVFVENRSLGVNALIKVPLTPLARTGICIEARALDSLQGKLRAPRLLYFAEDAGIAMQEYLAGKLGSRRCKPEYVRLLLDLVMRNEATSLRESGRGLAERLRACSDYGAHAETLDAALALLEDDAAVPPARIHGDFVPWNLRELPDGNCTLLDWELARQRGLPLYDFCHFYYMQSLLFYPETCFYDELLREGAWRGYFEQLGLAQALLPRLAAAFLLEMLAGYWEAPETSIDWFCMRQLGQLLGSQTA